MRNIVVIAGGAMLFAFGTAADHADKKNNYDPVTARVTKVERQCYLTKRESRRRSWTTDLGDCRVAERYAAEHPEYVGATVNYVQTASVSYRAPGSSRTWRSSIKLEGARHKSIRRGSTIELLAAKEDRTKLREI